MTMKSINLTLPLIISYPYFPFIRPCINSTHFKLVCCHFWCILFSYSLYSIMIYYDKQNTYCIYIYISYIFFTALYHIPSSSIATSLILRTFPSLQQVEGSSPASLPLSSLDVPRLKRNLGLWNLKSFKRDRWNHRRWSACHFTEIAVPFSPKGWSVPWQFGWLLSRLSCQCLYVSRPVGWNHSGAAAAPASWTDQSWHIRRMPIDTLPQNMYPLVI